MRDPLLTRTRAQIAADNRAEIDGWIDERAAELAAGGNEPAEARRLAIEEFGDVAQAQRYAVRQDVATDRRMRARLWVEAFGSDVRIAIRTLARAPLVAGIVLMTFALGIGAATAVFSAVYAMLLRPLPYGDEDALVQLQPVENGVIRPAARYSAVAVVALRERTTSFTGIVGVESGNAVITGHGDPEQVTGAGVTFGGFDVLQAQPTIGRAFGARGESGPGSPVVVLLDGLWRRRFGADPEIVGRTIVLSGTRRQVIGVMPPGFRVPTYEGAEFLTPRDLAPLLGSANNAEARFLRLFARLKPGVSAQTAQADVDRAMRGLRTEFSRSLGDVDTRIVPIRTAVAGDARPRLLVLMGAAAFVLLLACANVAGILLSRAVTRRHELSVRVALGAGRHRLIRQFLAEGAVLAVAGAGLGLLIAERGITVLQRIAAAALPTGTVLALEPRVVLFATTVTVLAALASSLVPALAATRAIGVALRRDEARTSTSGANRRTRLTLVAIQLAVSVVLLIGAGLFLRTFQGLSALPLGYATDHTLTFRLSFPRSLSNPEQDAFWASLYEQLRAIPGVLSVGAGNVPTSGQSTVTGLEVAGRLVERGRLPDVRYTPASDGYFATLGIPIVRGRTFGAADRDGAPWVAVVSVGLAQQLWPADNPIGARVRTEPGKPWATIVGIVGDVRMGGADAPLPSIYTSQRQDHWPGGGAVVMRADGDLAALSAGIRQAVTRVDPTLPVIGLKTLEAFRRSTPAMAERRLLMQLILAFALVALAVSAIGVYGVSAYATAARRREFGIHLALGASRRRVLWLALRDSAQVAVLGACAGLPIAALLAARLRDLLYAVTPFDPLTVSAALGLLVVVAFAAALVPARQATRIDPAQTMRTDG